MEAADARTNMQVHWALGIVALALLAAGSDIVAAILVGIGQYFRNRVGDEKPGIEEIISFHPAWKWFTVAYYLMAAGLALHFMGELYRLSVGVAVLLFIFPLAVAWVRYDVSLYEKLKSA